MEDLQNTKFDAIVIGSGISGGWAAKELCENGLKTLVLERGRMVKHLEDYPTMNMDPWDFEYRNEQNPEAMSNQLKQKRFWNGALIRPESKHFFVDDLKHPYNEPKRFDWIRGYQVGGRSLVWGRQSYRLSDMDFEANLNDGHGIDWPVRYADIAPWYDKVEEFIGVSGEKLGLDHLPDGKFTTPMELNCVEIELQKKIEENFDDRLLTIGRVANKTGDQVLEGRSNCQNRNRCIRGCPYGGYFSSNSSTIPAAQRTGNLTIRPLSVVYEIVYDDHLKRATGVKVLDAETKEEFFFETKIIFCCASALASAGILMHSKSQRFPNGLGNDSGELGHNIMDHQLGAGASASIKGFEDQYYKGRRPNGFYIPRFVNMPGKNSNKDFIRGYGYQGGASRSSWQRSVAEFTYGKDLKNDLLKPGNWQIGLGGFGECLPYHDNKMTLNYNKLDEWGLPTYDLDVEFKENEIRMREDIQKEASSMLKVAGFSNVQTFDSKDSFFPGNGIHEMGTARMGRDPKTSVLNENNQIHAVPNVYVTDGAFMTSSACQNPSLTYMAFTARAANHAAKFIKTIV